MAIKPFNSTGGFSVGPNLTEFIDANNNANIANLTVGGTANLANVEITGNLIASENITANDTISGTNLTISNTANIANINVSGTANIANVEMTGNLIADNITSNNSLDVLGTANVGGDLNVTGIANINGVSIQEGLISSTGATLFIQGAMNQSLYMAYQGNQNSTTSLVYADSNGSGLETAGGDLVIGPDGNVTASDSMIIGGNLTANGNTSVANITANGVVQLGNVANVRITGGSNLQFLQTDGTGNLTWATVDTDTLANGTSNVSIDTANGPVTVGVAGNANVAVFSGTGLTVQSNIDAGNITANSTLAGANLTISDTGNITSTLFVGGNVTANANLAVTANANITNTLFVGGNVTANANLVVTTNANIGGTSNVVGTAEFGNTVDITGILTTTTDANIGGNLTVTGDTNLDGTLVTISTGDLVLNQGLTTHGNVIMDADVAGGGAITIGSTAATKATNVSISGANVTLGEVANLHILGGSNLQFLQTNGSGNLVWATVDTDTLANGTSNVSIDTANSNVTVGVAGNANVAVFSGTGLTVQSNIDAGNITLTANVTTANLTANALVTLGNVANVKITGGSNLQFLQTDGTGNLVWATPAPAAVANGTSNVSIDTLNGPVTIGVNGSSNIAKFNQSNIEFTDGTNTAFTFDLAAKFLTMIDAADNQVGVAPTQIALNSTNADYMTDLQAGAWSLSDNIAAGSPQTYITPGFVTTYYGGNSAPVMPTNPDHLTTKAYVDEKSYIANGTSNVNIATANGNVTVSVGGNANIVTVTDTGANVTGTVTATGNITGANLVTAGNVYAENIVNITANTSIGMGNGSGVLSIISAGNSTQFRPSGQVELSGVSQLVGGTFAGSGITVAGTQTDIFQNRGGNVTVQVGTGGTIANTWTFGNNGNLSAPGDINTTANVSAGNLAVTSNVTFANASGANVNATYGITTANLTANALVTLGAVANVKIAGGSNLQFLQTDGAGNLSWATVSVSSIANGTSNVNIATANGNVTVGANGQGNIITVASNGTYATTTVLDDMLVTGNLTVQGNTITVNVTELNVEDPIITEGRGANNQPLTTNDGKDRGLFSYYYDTTELGGFIGLRTTGAQAGQYILSANATVTDNAVTVNTYGNLILGNVIGNLANGNSSVSIASANGAITLNPTGTANVVVATTTGIDVTGSVKVRTVTSIDAATVTTAGATPTTLASITDAAGLAVEFVVKGFNTTDGTFETFTILAISSGGACDYTIFGNTQIGGSPGSAIVSVLSGNMVLTVTSTAAASNTVWAVQYRTF